ncbi:E3 ubiquitin-protein ligase BRE1A-like [Schistocerca piceifrons]|uniref:E3 ubiquitin-protein ligase BRE1A-like n=1 Tax=Schistocerca piceifrons TaxID=274613 RepID=UPI001F5FEE25|nr:E3 ubiquitin-protein ligase BRE1A-like [Schistocerca piceifrons]
MDNEQQSVSSDTELESGTQSNVSDVVQEVQCENLGAEGQEMLPLPPSDSVDSGNTVPSASTGHGPESGEVSEVQSLRDMFERMLNFQAEFVRVQAERDRERDAKQAERDRERDAEQAERDQRLVAEFACMQAERDRERDAEQAERDQRLVAEFAKQAERDRERDAKQAERDRRLHERDLQLMQTLEVMQSEIVSLKQKYETIPKTVQELSERVDSVQVANANIVEEISVLTNRVEQLEIDTTQVIENKVIEQVHKVENEVIKEIDQKVHAAIEARDVGSSADVQDLKRIVHKDIPLWQRSVDRRLAEMELSLRHDEARAYDQDATVEDDVCEEEMKALDKTLTSLFSEKRATIRGSKRPPGRYELISPLMASEGIATCISFADTVTFGTEKHAYKMTISYMTNGVDKRQII